MLELLFYVKVAQALSYGIESNYEQESLIGFRFELGLEPMNMNHVSS